MMRLYRLGSGITDFAELYLRGLRVLYVGGGNERINRYKQQTGKAGTEPRCREEQPCARRAGRWRLA